MNPISPIAEEESKRLFWVVQTVFGFIIGRSFYDYASVFFPPFAGDLITPVLALASIYACVLWSWVDFSYTLVVSPYNLKGNRGEKYRFLSDLFIVLIYSYLLAYLQYIRSNPTARILELFVAFALVYFGYAISGLLRIAQYGRRASRIVLILVFFGLFTLLTIVYYYFTAVHSSVFANRLFISMALLLTCGYRSIRAMLAKRSRTIAVDVDGVLANQIEGILPVVKQMHDIDLKYDSVTDWCLKIGDTSIDRIIVSQQQERSYVLNMPVHAGAKKALDRIIRRHYVAIATARPPTSDTWTQEWLRKNSISYDRFYNLKEGGKHNAGEDFDVLIDDHVGNIEAFLKGHSGKAVLFSQPWNQNRDHLASFIEEGRLKIAKVWEEMPSLITGLLNQTPR
jgi:5'(3')-deoxyribonucleotidase